MGIFTSNNYPAALNTALKAAKKVLATRARIISAREAACVQLAAAESEVRTARASLGFVEAGNCMIEGEQPAADAKMARRKLSSSAEAQEVLEVRIAGFADLLRANDVELRTAQEALLSARQLWMGEKLAAHRTRVDEAISLLRDAIGVGVALTHAMDRFGAAAEYQRWLREMVIRDPLQFGGNLLAQPVDGIAYAPVRTAQAEKEYEASREPAEVARALEAEIATLDRVNYHVGPTVENDTSTPPVLQHQEMPTYVPNDSFNPWPRP
jgi:hypothetical protein